MHKQIKFIYALLIIAIIGGGVTLCLLREVDKNKASNDIYDSTKNIEDTIEIKFNFYNPNQIKTEYSYGDLLVDNNGLINLQMPPNDYKNKSSFKLNSFVLSDRENKELKYLISKSKEKIFDLNTYGCVYGQDDCTYEGYIVFMVNGEEKTFWGYGQNNQSEEFKQIIEKLKDIRERAKNSNDTKGFDDLKLKIKNISTSGLSESEIIKELGKPLTKEEKPAEDCSHFTKKYYFLGYKGFIFKGNNSEDYNLLELSFSELDENISVYLEINGEKYKLDKNTKIDDVRNILDFPVVVFKNGLLDLNPFGDYHNYLNFKNNKLFNFNIYEPC